MNANPTSRIPREFAWPGAGLLLGSLIAFIPSTGISLDIGIAVWFLDVVLVLALSGHPIGARIAALVAGLCMAVPCFISESPLSRFLLECVMAVPFICAAALVGAPTAVRRDFRTRLAYLCTWCGTRKVERHARIFDVAAFQKVILASVVLAAAIAGVKAASAFGLGLPMRWLAGGIGAIACGEMATGCVPLMAGVLGLTVPALFDSPYRSTSIGEFWTKRWNVGASALFRKCAFAPFARRGVAWALFAAFAASAVGHLLLAYLALGKWGAALACGAFFLVQPLLIAAERWMNVRRWRPAAGRAWTLVALAITSPLFVEPALQIMEPSWGPADMVLTPTLAVLGFCIVVSGVLSLASLATSAPVVAEVKTSSSPGIATN